MAKFSSRRYTRFDMIPEDKQPAISSRADAQRAYDLGELHHSNRRFEHALEQFQIAHKLDPENDRYLFKLAAAYHNVGKYQESVERYSELIDHLRSKPFKEQLLLALAYKGGNLAMLDKFDEAEELIDQALEMDSVSPIGLGMRGLLFLRQNKINDAIHSLNLAHEIDPDNKIVNVIRRSAIGKL